MLVPGSMVCLYTRFEAWERPKEFGMAMSVGRFCLQTERGELRLIRTLRSCLFIRLVEDSTPNRKYESCLSRDYHGETVFDTLLHVHLAPIFESGSLGCVKISHRAPKS